MAGSSFTTALVEATLKVTISAEELEAFGVSDDDKDLAHVMDQWALAEGPFLYNRWQSLYFHLLRDHGFVDPDAPEDEPPRERQTRLKASYSAKLEEIHGPEWKRLVAEAAKARRQESARSAPPELPLPGQASAEVSSALVPVQAAVRRETREHSSLQQSRPSTPLAQADEEEEEREVLTPPPQRIEISTPSEPRYPRQDAL